MVSKKWQALDVDGNVIDTWSGPKKESRIGVEWNGTLIDSIEPYEPPKDPRKEREEVFAKTLDKLNWFWAESMTPDQQTEVAEWRQAWLDYPETGVKPDMLPYLPY